MDNLRSCIQRQTNDICNDMDKPHKYTKQWKTDIK